MKYPLDWLKEYTDLPADQKKLAAICEQLGFAVEEINKEVLDLEITPNRGDCLSILGLGRELAIEQGRATPLYPAGKLPRAAYTKKSAFLDFSFPPKGITRFSGAIIRGCQTAPSPEKIRRRLKLAGIRPLTNIIDITNYVMLELGQPLHAFDLKAIADRQFRIVEAKEGEEIITLDGKNRRLSTGSLIVKDSQKNIDLCGIIGGFYSEIKPETIDIFLQAAIFPRPLIRKTCRQLNLTTEASYRYEREVDYNICLPALAMAAEMLRKLAGGEIVEWLDFEIEKESTREITLHLDNIEKKIGLAVEKQKANSTLTAIGLKMKKDSGQNVVYTIPGWRHDLVWEEDLLEEIARFIGYHKIPAAILKKIPVKNRSTAYHRQLNIKEFLRQRGLIEVINYSFLSRKLAELSGADRKTLVEIANPLSSEQEVLRPNLAIGLIKSLAVNPDDKTTPIWEIGKIFSQPLKERWQIGACQWQGINLVQKLFPKEKIKTISLNHPLAEIFTLRRTVEVAEMALDDFSYCHSKELEKISHKGCSLARKIKFKPLAKFPALRRDLAIVVDKNIPSEEIINNIYQIDKRVFLVELFDEYEHPRLGGGKKGLAFHIVYQDLEKTMIDETAEQLQQKTIASLADKFKAKLRS